MTRHRSGSTATPYEVPDVPTGLTEQFVFAHWPAGALRVLEVGCGDGALAERLQGRGLNVTALDVSAESIARARARGVTAVEADFLRYSHEPFDVVVFSRVLHHLDPLPLAVDRAADLLEPGGIVIAEEFAIERTDEETARWYYELRSLLEAARILVPTQTERRMPEHPLDLWREHHVEHGPVHPGETMLEELRRRFEITYHAQVPYLFRYFWPRIDPSPRGANVAEWIHARESQRVREGSLRPIGLRIVGRKRG